MGYARLVIRCHRSAIFTPLLSRVLTKACTCASLRERQAVAAYRLRGNKMRRVYVNEEVCIGCGLCCVYCLTEHSSSKEVLRAFKKETPRAVARVRVERNGEVSFSVQCRHCDEPWCVYSCLTGAMQKDPVTGIVTVDPARCIGCWTCVVACPYGALARDPGSHVVAKCDLCPEHPIPVCVANCPNEALMVVQEDVSQ